jgi:peptidyl-tRNA hydrolase
VLGKFTPAEQELIQKVKDTAAEAVQTFIIEGAEAAMQKYNGSLVSI